MTSRSGRLNSNTKVAVVCAAVAAGMVGLAYASVPLYSLFCSVTGYGGTTQRVEAPSHQVLDRMVTVRFDSNVAPGLDWDFAPVVNSMKLHIGENALAFYRATNHSTVPVVGTATFNVTPEQAGSFFNKIQCFCFTEQRLEPGETVDMPVSFYVDPAIVNDPDGAFMRTITLSYTFYPVAKPNANAALNTPAPAPAGPPTKPPPNG
jgi:cytochrome c oxidase assembly protein subunit 11